MKQLVVQLAAMQPAPARRPIEDGKRLLADIEEGRLLTGIRDCIEGLDDTDLAYLWDVELHKALPPGRNHVHGQRKRLAENLLAVLPASQPSLRLIVMEALEKITRNDALYSTPDPSQDG